MTSGSHVEIFLAYVHQSKLLIWPDPFLARRVKKKGLARETTESATLGDRSLSGAWPDPSEGQPRA